MTRAGRPENTAQPAMIVKRPLHPIVLAMKRRRAELGITQRVLAERMGYGVSNIKNWEQGKYLPVFQALMDWAEALGIRITLEPEE